MTYAVTNPPKLIVTGIAGRGNIWLYRSEDADTAVDAPGYITDAKALGMKAGDFVIVIDTNATPIAGTFHFVTEINADGSADLSVQVAAAPAAGS